MTIGLSIIWIIFTILFFLLGCFYWKESRRTIPLLKLTKRKYSGSDSPIRFQIDVAGTPLDKPLEDFVMQFNTYLGEQNSSSKNTNQRAAIGYYLAALTALLSMFVEWFNYFSKQFSNQ